MPPHVLDHIIQLRAFRIPHMGQALRKRRRRRPGAGVVGARHHDPATPASRDHPDHAFAGLQALNPGIGGTEASPCHGPGAQQDPVGGSPGLGRHRHVHGHGFVAQSSRDIGRGRYFLGCRRLAQNDGRLHEVDHPIPVPILQNRSRRKDALQAGKGLLRRRLHHGHAGAQHSQKEYRNQQRGPSGHSVHYLSHRSLLSSPTNNRELVESDIKKKEIRSKGTFY